MTIKTITHASVLLLLPALGFSAVTWQSGPGYQFGNTRITVSSVLPSKHGTHYYGPRNLFEARKGKAWCASYRTDRRPWVKIQFDAPVKFQRFYVMNGYTKSRSSFLNNYRPKRVLVSTKNVAEPVTLKDTPKEQTVKLSRPVKSRWVKFTVLDNYPSKKFDDVCITGITVDQEQFN